MTVCDHSMASRSNLSRAAIANTLISSPNFGPEPIFRFPSIALGECAFSKLFPIQMETIPYNPKILEIMLALQAIWIYKDCMNNILTTPKEVIDALGGYSEVAAIVGVGYNAVFEWPRGESKRIPPKFYKVISDELSKRGKEALPSVWGFEERAS